MTLDGDPVLSRYITHVRALPLLTREDEHELAVRVRDHGDRSAAERLVHANLRYAVSIAATYRRFDLRLSELIAEGNLGLVTAVGKFDPDKGTRFVTYAAYWMRAFILNHVIRTWSLVGGGSGALRSKVFFRLRRERARMAGMADENEAALKKLAEQLGTTTTKVEEMLRRVEGRDVSLDVRVSEDSKTTGLDLLEDERAPQDAALDARQRADTVDGRVRVAIGSLDQRERYIVENRFMADDEVSLAELGRRLGVSRERARQLEARARKKLMLRLADLRDLDAA